MVLAAALASFGVSLLVGGVVFQRARSRLGPSWEEWHDAERLGGRWAPLVKAAVSAATLVGPLGLGAPAALRAALLGTVVGFCVPFAIEGVRRYLRRGRVPARQHG